MISEREWCSGRDGAGVSRVALSREQGISGVPLLFALSVRWGSWGNLACSRQPAHSSSDHFQKEVTCRGLSCSRLCSGTESKRGVHTWVRGAAVRYQSERMHMVWKSVRRVLIIRAEHADLQSREEVLNSHGRIAILRNKMIAAAGFTGWSVPQWSLVHETWCLVSPHLQGRYTRDGYE